MMIQRLMQSVETGIYMKLIAPSLQQPFFACFLVSRIQSIPELRARCSQKDKNVRIHIHETAEEEAPQALPLTVLVHISLHSMLDCVERYL